MTEVYGLDDLLLDKLTCIEGTIDRELFHTGSYVLLREGLSSVFINFY